MVGGSESLWRESNPRPTAYKAVALKPLSYTGVKYKARISLKDLLFQNYSFVKLSLTSKTLISQSERG